MKRRVDIEQIEQLTKEQLNIIREWWKDSPPAMSDLYYVRVLYDGVEEYGGPYLLTGHRKFIDDYYIGDAFPLLSIGQMIEFLQHSKTQIYLDDTHWYDENLCDALWENVKIVVTRNE